MSLTLSRQAAGPGFVDGRLRGGIDSDDQHAIRDASGRAKIQCQMPFESRTLTTPRICLMSEFRRFLSTVESGLESRARTAPFEADRQLHTGASCIPWSNTGFSMIGKGFHHRVKLGCNVQPPALTPQESTYGWAGSRPGPTVPCRCPYGKRISWPRRQRLSISQTRQAFQPPKPLVEPTCRLYGFQRRRLFGRPAIHLQAGGDGQWVAVNELMRGRPRWNDQGNGS